MAIKRDDLAQLPPIQHNEFGQPYGSRGCYDWATYSAGEAIYEFHQGVDFSVPVLNFVRVASAYASRHGMRVHIRKLTNTSLLMQFKRDQNKTED